MKRSPLLTTLGITSVIIGWLLESVTAAPTGQELIEISGVRGGLVVHVGCDDGLLTAQLLRNDSFVVHGLDTDPDDIDAARRHIRSLGLYGKVSVCRFDGRYLPYADNLVSLLVVSDPSSVDRDEFLRVLCPGGVCIKDEVVRTKDKSGGPREERVATIALQPSALGLQSSPTTPQPSASSLQPFKKPWPEDIDEWTHWLHDADGNPVAQDTVVGPPRQMQWFARPMWSRSHEKSPSLTGMVSAKGRLFYICDEGPASIGGPLPDRWKLVARDAFSGVLLWKQPVPDWGWQAWSPSEPMNLRWGNPRFVHRRLVAVNDRVYVTPGYSAPVAALDAATGRTLRVYGESENTCEILYRDGLLILSVATTPKDRTDQAPPLKVVAFDADDGRQRWQAGPFPSLYDLGERGKSNVLKQGRLMIAADTTQVYAVTQQDILALDIRDGSTAWSMPRSQAVLPGAGGKKAQAAVRKMFTNLGSIMVHSGRVFVAQPHVPTNKLVNNVPMTLVCLSAETGKENWRRICGDWSYTTNLNVYAVRDLIWVHHDPSQGRYDLLGLDPATGLVQAQYDLASVLSTRHHHRCYRNKATENFLLMGKEGVEYVDLEDGAVQPHRWLRGMCLYGIMPANGLLYVPPQACSCNPMTMLQGYWALAAEESRVESPESSEEERLERGPAYELALDSGPSTLDSSDWPMYRHDPLRSGATTCGVNAPVSRRWRTKVGGELTGPVVAGGRVYLGRRDTHELIALDALDGSLIWRYGMGGSMDSPPTVHRGTALAGCADGCVYCLRAADGALMWRFQAAPGARYVVADNHVESVWPVHGSVMVHDDIAYVTAGRSSFLDGGIRLYMLDPRTGRVIQQKTFYTEQTDQEVFYEGVTSDLLVSDGSGLFMRHLRLDPKTLEFARMGWWGFKDPQPKGKDRGYVKQQDLPVSETRCNYLRSGQGFLDDSLYGRTQFHLEGGEACHFLCFDEQRSYGFQLSTHTGHFVFFTPGDQGYSVLCFDRDPATLRRNNKIWQQKLPLRAYAMVLAGENLFLCGVPDVVDADDPLGAFEGRKGASLIAMQAETGDRLTEHTLDAPPVFDGLIAADHMLYLTDRDGQVSCLVGRQNAAGD